MIRPARTVTIYSAKVYFHWGKFPPLCAPDSVWREWHRLQAEAGEAPTS